MSNTDKQQANQEDAKATYFRSARQGMATCKVRDWPPSTEKLHLALDEFELYKVICQHWYNDADIAVAVREHFQEAWDTAWELE